MRSALTHPTKPRPFAAGIRPDQPSALAQRLIRNGCEPARAAATDDHELAERLARYLEPDAFVGRRRSSRNQHVANITQTRARKLAKRILNFRPIAEALARGEVPDACF